MIERTFMLRSLLVSTYSCLSEVPLRWLMQGKRTTVPTASLSFGEVLTGLGLLAIQCVSTC